MLHKTLYFLLLLTAVNGCGRNPSGFGQRQPPKPCIIQVTTAPDTKPEPCSSRKGLNTEERRLCAIEDGVSQLLDHRNEEFEWGSKVEAEGVLAIHLANDTKFSKRDPYTYISVKQMENDLLSAININADLTDVEWGHGKLAHYTLALTALCQNPNDFYGLRLLDKLKNHLTVSSQYFQGNKFAYALVILALCASNVTLDTSYYQKISPTPGTYTFKVDEAAMVYQALKCINGPQFNSQAQAALDYILSKRTVDGLFGNEYTTALAVQAIYASKNKTLYSETIPGINFLVDSVDRLMKPNAAKLLSVLPAIGKKTYVDVRHTHCIFPGRDVFRNISIHISVFNNITSTFSMTWTVQIGGGQTLYDAMQNLQSTDAVFRFSSQSSTFGHYITSLCGMTPSANDNQYWQILDGDHQSLQTGVDATFPEKGDSFIFNLTTW